VVHCALILAALLVTACASEEKPRQGAAPDGRLFLKLLRGGGEPVVALDPATGRQAVVPYSRVAGGDPPFQLSVTGGRLVFYGGRGSARGRGVYVVDAAGLGRPRLLGRPWYFVPSATEGRIWFVRPAPGAPDTWREPVSVAELTVPAGRTTVRGARPPCRGPSTLAAVAGALLCQARTELRAFDPASGRVLARLPGPFPAATHGTRVAWCAQACRRVHVTDVRTGRTMAIAPGAGFEFEATYEGAFSPDGSLLAMPALERQGGRRLAVIDVAAHRSVLVPHSRLAGYRQLTWSGGWLVFTAGRSRLMAWQRGSGRAVGLPVEVRGTIMDMAASR
jgi:hypothetical protein